MKLRELIIDYRKRMNISQREFSRRCDLSNSYISFLEKGINPKTGKPIVPTIEQYKKLADGMDISVNRLFELLDDDAPVDLHFSIVSEKQEIHHPEIRLLASRMDRLPKEQRDQALDVFNAMYHKFFDQMEDEKK